jgi:hypothetical protein
VSESDGTREHFEGDLDTCRVFSGFSFLSGYPEGVRNYFLRVTNQDKVCNSLRYATFVTIPHLPLAVLGSNSRLSLVPYDFKD